MPLPDPITVAVNDVPVIVDFAVLGQGRFDRLEATGNPVAATAEALWMCTRELFPAMTIDDAYEAIAASFAEVWADSLAGDDG